MGQRVLIIGGGVIGCCTALESAKRGNEVLVLDKEPEGKGEGSLRSMGSLRIQGRQPAELPLAVYALKLWRELSENYDFEFVPGGNLYVAEHATELSAIREYAAQAHELGLDEVQVMSADQVTDIAPFKPGVVAGALYSPMDAQCNPPKAVAALKMAALSAGVAFRHRTLVTHLLVDDGTVNGAVTAEGDVIRADVTVVASGVWSAALLSPVGVSVPIKKVLSTQAETTAVAPVMKATLRAFSFSARQRPTGEAVLGGGLNARVDKVISVDDLSDMRRWMPRYLHNRRSIRLRLDARELRRELSRNRSSMGLRDATLCYPEPRRVQMEQSLDALKRSVRGFESAQLSRIWSGFIDNTLDGLPVIQRPERPAGLIVLAGFSGHGLGIAPAVGSASADLVDGTASRFNLEPFRHERFGDPKLAIAERFV